MTDYTDTEEKDIAETVVNPAPETAGDGLAEIATTLIDEMPEVSQHAVDAHLAKEKAAQNAPAQTDKNGTKFDPTFHTVNAEGSPVLTKTGLYARKRGRKAGASTLGSMPGTSPSGNSTRPLGEPGNVPTTGQKVSPAVMGAVAASLTVQVGMVAFGEDLTPDAKNALTGVSDMETLTGAYRDYFIATNRQDFPPLMALVFAIGSYAGPKLVKPKATTRAKQLALGIADGARNFWRKYKAWRNGPEVAKAA